MATVVRRIVSVVALFLWVAGTAAAQDFEQGRAAQKRGDFAAALAVWQPLAERGHAGAQNGLGLLYDNGEGVPQNHRRAIAWYRKAAAQGYADAQYNLGLMYANGLGVSQNYEKARAWYEKAVGQGHKEAKVNLDVLYLMGHISKNSQAKQAAAASDVRATKTALRQSEPAQVLGTSKPGLDPEGKPVAKLQVASAESEQAAEASAATAKPTAAEVTPVGPPTPLVPKTMEQGPGRKAAASGTAGDAAGGEFRVQLSSVKTELRAMKEAVRLKQAHQSLLGPLKIEPVRVDLGDRGVFYRLRAGPVADWNAAKDLCRALADRNQGCLVVTPQARDRAR